MAMVRKQLVTTLPGIASEPGGTNGAGRLQNRTQGLFAQAKKMLTGKR